MALQGAGTILLLVVLILFPVGSFSFVVPASSYIVSAPRVGGPLSRRSILTHVRAAGSPSADDKNTNAGDQDIKAAAGALKSGSGLGDFEPQKKIPIKREVIVGDPQQKVKKQKEDVTDILRELAAIQSQGPQKYCLLGTRHCSFLHQTIIELLAYALVLSGNHMYTSGAVGTHAAAIKGALRAERPDLLTVVLPQSMDKQPPEIQDLLKEVTDLITMPQNDEMSLEMSSRICNSYLLSQTDQLISFAFHDSTTVNEATKEAKKLDMLVTALYLD
mmetsp:Transcript_484/g.1447  ORF Transcript_484/g.1447 Transcript_484/m.1447 type:complete len:275 (+) Transcript_484:216-1040(+)